MLSCKQISQLVSDSFERELGFWERAQLKLHVLMCKMCAGHKRDLEQLREMIKSKLNSDVDAEGSERLAPEARERIRKVIDSLN